MDPAVIAAIIGAAAVVIAPLITALLSRQGARPTSIEDPSPKPDERLPRPLPKGPVTDRVPATTPSRRPGRLPSGRRRVPPDDKAGTNLGAVVLQPSEAPEITKLVERRSGPESGRNISGSEGWEALQENGLLRAYTNMFSSLETFGKPDPPGVPGIYLVSFAMLFEAPGGASAQLEWFRVNTETSRHIKDGVFHPSDGLGEEAYMFEGSVAHSGKPRYGSAFRIGNLVQLLSAHGDLTLEEFRALAEAVALHELPQPVARPSRPLPKRPATDRVPARSPSSSANLAVDSWPSGAVVYAVRAEGKVVDAEIEKITRRSNRLGKTPVREKIDPGAYFIAVSYDAHLLTKLGFQLPSADEPTKDVFPSDLSQVSALSFENNMLSSLTRIFAVTVDGPTGSPATIVSLAVPVPTDQRGQPTPKIYPTPTALAALGSNYDVIDDHVTAAIQKNVAKMGIIGVVDDGLIADMVEALHKVGKVRLFTDGDDIVVQMSDQGFSVMVYS